MSVSVLTMTEPLPSGTPAAHTHAARPAAAVAASAARAPQPPPPPRAFATGVPQERAELLAAAPRWPRPERLARPLPVRPGKLSEGLDALGLRSVGELLEHLPRERRLACTIAELGPGEQ